MPPSTLQSIVWKLLDYISYPKLNLICRVSSFVRKQCHVAYWQRRLATEFNIDPFPIDTRQTFDDVYRFMYGSIDEKHESLLKVTQRDDQRLIEYCIDHVCRQSLTECVTKAAEVAGFVGRMDLITKLKMIDLQAATNGSLYGAALANHRVLITRLISQLNGPRGFIIVALNSAMEGAARCGHLELLVDLFNLRTTELRHDIHNTSDCTYCDAMGGIVKLGLDGLNQCLINAAEAGYREIVFKLIELSKNQPRLDLESAVSTAIKYGHRGLTWELLTLV